MCKDNKKHIISTTFSINSPDDYVYFMEIHTIKGDNRNSLLHHVVSCISEPIVLFLTPAQGLLSGKYGLRFVDKHIAYQQMRGHRVMSLMEVPFSKRSRSTYPLMPSTLPRSVNCQMLYFPPPLNAGTLPP